MPMLPSKLSQPQVLKFKTKIATQVSDVIVKITEVDIATGANTTNVVAVAAAAVVVVELVVSSHLLTEPTSKYPRHQMKQQAKVKAK